VKGRVLYLVYLTALSAATRPSNGQESDLPRYLSDRGTGVPTSMFGTYVSEHQFLVYPFFEYYLDNDLEYKPSELGYGVDQDYRGKYRASEGLLFIGYGITPNVAVEFEAAVITARLEKAGNDTSAQPTVVEESGLGDVEGQIRWRFLTETETRPELFTFFETVFPLQKDKYLIGTRDWEFKLGVGAVRGFAWGTMTLRLAVEYAREEKKVDTGEFALEYLRRLSQEWRIYAGLEVSQLDEATLITEVQWHFFRQGFLKANVGWGVTTNATDFAPEIGVMFVL
jgi:hypothetical protein